MAFDGTNPVSLEGNGTCFSQVDWGCLLSGQTLATVPVLWGAAAEGEANAFDAPAGLAAWWPAECAWVLAWEPMVGFQCVSAPRAEYFGLVKAGGLQSMVELGLPMDQELPGFQTEGWQRRGLWASSHEEPQGLVEWWLHG